VKYVFMDEHQGIFGVSAMSRVLQVSRSGFYAWRRRRDNPSPRQQRRKQLDEAVKNAFDARKGRSGSPRLVRDLADAGYQHDRKTIAESMRRQGLRAKAAKKFKATTNSRHNLPVAPNLLHQDFTASRPNKKYVGDIAYLWTEEGWLYLVCDKLYSSTSKWTTIEPADTAPTALSARQRLRQTKSLNCVSAIGGQDHPGAPRLADLPV
jgi:putative transposase